MLQSIKPLIVVLVLELLAFAVVKSAFLNFMTPQAFARRRNVWLMLTMAAFLSPNIWLFTLIALPLIYWAAQVDEHPTALYVMLLLIVPPVSVPIPMPAINQLFELTYFRILAFALLIPTGVRLLRNGRANSAGLVKIDLILLAFGALQLAVYFPYESITHTMRRTFLFLLDTFLLYYVFSRGVATKEAMRDTLASFCLACMLLVPVVAFESARGWLLFIGIPENWGSSNVFAYLMRGDSLRAQASLGHSLTMGYALAIAFGFWMYLGGQLASKRQLWAGGIALWVGLLAAYSRAPWIVAAVVAAIFMIVSPTGRRNLVKASVALAVLAVPFSFTPPGQRMIDALPFVGTVDQGNVDYREQLATLSWRLIQINPFFGDPFASRNMEELRQGQGIIDIVNTYALVSLFYGLVGCALFVICFVYPMLRVAHTVLSERVADVDDINLGVTVAAAVIGSLVMMATCSFGGVFEFLSWTLSGLCCAYMAVIASRPQAAAEPAPVHRFSKLNQS
jgi:O-Antigen ligase